MRISYNQKVADYAKMSEAQLESQLRKVQEKELEGNWGFTRRAASTSGSALQTQLNATAEINAIRQALRRKRQKK